MIHFFKISGEASNLSANPASTQPVMISNGECWPAKNASATLSRSETFGSVRRTKCKGSPNVELASSLTVARLWFSILTRNDSISLGVNGIPDAIHTCLPSSEDRSKTKDSSWGPSWKATRFGNILFQCSPSEERKNVGII